MRQPHGQNFLVDKNIAYRIVESADIQKSDTIIEIGPGKAALTDILKDYTDNLIAVWFRLLNTPSVSKPNASSYALVSLSEYATSSPPAGKSTFVEYPAGACLLHAVINTTTGMINNLVFFIYESPLFKHEYYITLLI